MSLSSLLRCRSVLTLAAIAVLTLVILACGSTEAETPAPQTATTVQTTSPEPTLADPTPTIEPRRTPDGSDSSPGLIAAITDLVITEGSIVLEAGVDYDAEEIYFDSFNDGEELHQLTVVGWDGDPAGLPVDSSGQVVTTGLTAVELGTIGHSDYAIYEVEPIAPGNYVIFCNIPGHYGDGEYAPFTIHAPPPDATP